ncbi:MAG: hypothetical protein H0V53_00860 [Rubrobacter sp.]|nr:hypothetical protein [Rubrobacter sp.]
MADRAGDYEWREEGEEAEIVFYAPEKSVLGLPRLRLGVHAAARLPGVESPVYAAASGSGYGWVAASRSHAAPGLISPPRLGLLLTADVPLDRLGAPDELQSRFFRDLSEVPLPNLGGYSARAAAEWGGLWAAEEGFVEEEDLPFFPARRGDPEAVGRRALTAGVREWDPRLAAGEVHLMRVGEVLDPEGAEALGLEPGVLAVVADVGSGELGRRALEGHRARVSDREFDAPEGLSAAPADTEEAEDLLHASQASANYVSVRAALFLYALCRALGGVAGSLTARASWSIGGLEERGVLLLHRRGLAALGAGEVLAAGETVAAARGGMLGSAPPFGAGEDGERWPWEEAGLLERRVALEPLAGGER